MRRTNRRTYGLAAVPLVLLFAAASGGDPDLFDTPFGDVPHGHWAGQAIIVLARRGIVSGYPDSTFAGQRPLTRYEFAVAVQRLTQEPLRLDFPRFKPRMRPRIELPILGRPFADVPKEHWASDAVDWLREKGIAAGYSDGTFRGDRLMSRGEVSVAARRLCDFLVGLFGNEPSLGLTTLPASPGGRQDRPIRRYEFAVILYQVEAFYWRLVEGAVEPGLKSAPELAQPYLAPATPNGKGR